MSKWHVEKETKKNTERRCNTEMGKKLTVQEWVDKTGTSYSELARISGLNARTFGNATDTSDDNRTTDVTYRKIIIGLRKYFTMYPDLLEQGDELPKKPEDFAGIKIYDPNVHRAPRGTKKQAVERQP